MIRTKVCTILLIALLVGEAKRVYQSGLNQTEAATQDPIFITMCAIIGVSIGAFNAAQKAAELTDQAMRQYAHRRFMLELPNLIDEAYKPLPVFTGLNPNPRAPYSFDVYVRTESVAVSLVSAYLHCQNDDVLRALQVTMLKLQKIKAHGYTEEKLTEEDGAAWDIANLGFEFVDALANELVELSATNSAGLALWITQQAASRIVEHGMKDATVAQRLRKLKASESVSWGSTGLGLALGTVATFLDPSGLSIAALAIGALGAGEEAIEKVMSNNAWKTDYCPEIIKYASHKGGWTHWPKELMYATIMPVEAVTKAMTGDMVWITPRGKRDADIKALEKEQAARASEIANAAAARASKTPNKTRTPASQMAAKKTAAPKMANKTAASQRKEKGTWPELVASGIAA